MARRAGRAGKEQLELDLGDVPEPPAAEQRVQRLSARRAPRRAAPSNESSYQPALDLLGAGEPDGHRDEPARAAGPGGHTDVEATKQAETDDAERAQKFGASTTPGQQHEDAGNAAWPEGNLIRAEIRYDQAADDRFGQRHKESGSGPSAPEPEAAPDSARTEAAEIRDGPSHEARTEANGEHQLDRAAEQGIEAVAAPARNARTTGQQRTAARHPNDNAMADAQEWMRARLPELTNAKVFMTKGLPENEEKASEHLRAVLRAAGHPRADDAFVIRHEDPAARKSQVVMDPETRAPGVALHPDRWDWGTLAHEAGHILHAHADGREIDQLPTPEQKHGPEFIHHYIEALWRLPISESTRMIAVHQLRFHYDRAQKELAENSDILQFKPRSAFAEPLRQVGGNPFVEDLEALGLMGDRPQPEPEAVPKAARTAPPSEEPTAQGADSGSREVADDTHSRQVTHTDITRSTSASQSPDDAAAGRKANSGTRPRDRMETLRSAAERVPLGEFTVEHDGDRWTVTGRNASGKPVHYRYLDVPKDNHIKPGVDLGEEKAREMAELLRADYARETSPEGSDTWRSKSDANHTREGPRGGEWDRGSTATFTDSEGQRHTGQVWSRTNHNNEMFVVTPEQRAFRVSTESAIGEHEPTSKAEHTREASRSAESNHREDRPGPAKVDRGPGPRWDEIRQMNEEQDQVLTAKIDTAIHEFDREGLERLLEDPTCLRIHEHRIFEALQKIPRVDRLRNRNEPARPAGPPPEVRTEADGEHQVDRAGEQGIEAAVAQARNARTTVEQYVVTRDAAAAEAEERRRREEREQEQGQAMNGIGADRLASVPPRTAEINRENELGD